MNIKEALSGVYSKGQIETVAKYACSNTIHFDELMQCFLSNNIRLAQMASWSVSYSARLNPCFIKPYIKNLVEQLQRKDVHDAVIRNSIRILQDIEIPEEQHGAVMNSCFELIEQPSTPAAIKAFSLTTLYNLTKVYPEIKQELKLLIETLWDNESPAFKSRGRKILHQLNKNS
jgi:hypothetical protein